MTDKQLRQLVTLLGRALECQPTVTLLHSEIGERATLTMHEIEMALHKHYGVPLWYPKGMPRAGRERD